MHPSVPDPLPVPSGPFQSGRKAYYVNHCPFAAIFELVGGPKREVVFVDEHGRWTRYLSFESAHAMREAAIKHLPATIHIAGKYANLPAGNAQPVSRELVFDVDLDKFTSARAVCGCGSEKKACAKCWRFARLSMKILRYMLREVFGLAKFFFVFSGGRGFHAWVMDAEASRLNPVERGHLLSFLEFPNTVHPCVEAIYQEIIFPFAYAELRDIPAIAHALDHMLDPERRAVILEYTWPRLDRDVSRHLNHPLKIPFGLHASTNNVCYVLDEHCDDPFNPARAPSMHGSLDVFYKAMH